MEKKFTFEKKTCDSNILSSLTSRNENKMKTTMKKSELSLKQTKQFIFI